VQNLAQIFNPVDFKDLWFQNEATRSSLPLLAKTVMHPAARSLCDSWASCWVSYCRTWISLYTWICCQLPLFVFQSVQKQ